MKKGILFDLDNTLYNYDECHKNGLKESYKIIKSNYHLSFDEFCNYYHKARSEIHKELNGYASSHNRILYFQKIISFLNSDFNCDNILELYDSYYNGFFDEMILFEGVIDLLKKLKKKKIKTGIVTNLNSLIQLKKINYLGISKYIDVVVTSEESSREKPHSSIFLLALHKLNVKPNEVIMVGDSIESDILGANSLNIDSLLLDKNFNIDLNEYFSDKIKKSNCVKFQKFKEISDYLIEDFNLK
ncbi:MAG: HAD family hydrolase [Candidatus Woesearchaeota archaeon]